MTLREDVPHRAILTRRSCSTGVGGRGALADLLDAAIWIDRGAEPSRSSREARAKAGGEGGIRTPVPVTRQDAFEAPPLRPLRYLSLTSLGGAPLPFPTSLRARGRLRRLPSGARLRPRALPFLNFARWGPFTVPHLPPSLIDSSELRRGRPLRVIVSSRRLSRRSVLPPDAKADGARLRPQALP